MVCPKIWVKKRCEEIPSRGNNGRIPKGVKTTRGLGSSLRSLTAEGGVTAKEPPGQGGLCCGEKGKVGLGKVQKFCKKIEL